MKYLITTDISEHPDISDTTHLTYVSIIQEETDIPSTNKIKVYHTSCNKEYSAVYVHDITDISNYNHFNSKLFAK